MLIKRMALLALIMYAPSAFAMGVVKEGMPPAESFSALYTVPRTPPGTPSKMPVERTDSKASILMKMFRELNSSEFKQVGLILENNPLLVYAYLDGRKSKTVIEKFAEMVRAGNSRAQPIYFERWLAFVDPNSPLIADIKIAVGDDPRLEPILTKFVSDHQRKAALAAQNKPWFWWRVISWFMPSRTNEEEQKQIIPSAADEIREASVGGSHAGEVRFSPGLKPRRLPAKKESAGDRKVPTGKEHSEKEYQGGDAAKDATEYAEKSRQEEAKRRTEEREMILGTADAVATAGVSQAGEVKMSPGLTRRKLLGDFEMEPAKDQKAYAEDKGREKDEKELQDEQALKGATELRVREEKALQEKEAQRQAAEQALAGERSERRREKSEAQATAGQIALEALIRSQRRQEGDPTIIASKSIDTKAPAAILEEAQTGTRKAVTESEEIVLAEKNKQRLQARETLVVQDQARRLAQEEAGREARARRMIQAAEESRAQEAVDQEARAQKMLREAEESKAQEAAKKAEADRKAAERQARLKGLRAREEGSDVAKAKAEDNASNQIDAVEVTRLKALAEDASRMAKKEAELKAVQDLKAAEEVRAREATQKAKEEADARAALRQARLKAARSMLHANDLDAGHKVAENRERKVQIVEAPNDQRREVVAHGLKGMPETSQETAARLKREAEAAAEEAKRLDQEMAKAEERLKSLETTGQKEKKNR